MEVQSKTRVTLNQKLQKVIEQLREINQELISEPLSDVYDLKPHVLNKEQYEELRQLIEELCKEQYRLSKHLAWCQKCLPEEWNIFDSEGERIHLTFRVGDILLGRLKENYIFYDWRAFDPPPLVIGTIVNRENRNRGLYPASGETLHYQIDFAPSKVAALRRDRLLWVPEEDTRDWKVIYNIFQ